MLFRSHRRLHDKFAISGGIPNMMLSYGKPEEVREFTKRVLREVAADGGYILDAGAIMQDVVGNAGQASGLMGTLADSARSQSRSIGEVESAVQALDSATQQNAALVEQTTSAATSLADSAHQLSQEVSFFKLA